MPYGFYQFVRFAAMAIFVYLAYCEYKNGHVDRMILFIVLTSAFIVACSSSNIPQKLDSFVDNAELKSSDYDAEDWQKSMLQYERLVEEYNNSACLIIQNNADVSPL